MGKKDIVVVGASTGGIQALKVLAGGLPAGLRSSLLVVQHTGAGSPETLDRILAPASPLAVSYAADGERVAPGRIYLARADFHLLVESSGRMRLVRGPKENSFRPAIDPLFRSAALAFSRRVVGVILTGALDDGTAGLWAVKENGGVAIVQNPEEAVAPSMPLNALKHVEVDHCVPLHCIPELLARLSTTPAEESGLPPPKGMREEVNSAFGESPFGNDLSQAGEPSPFACPECHGAMLQIASGSSTHFRCHAGHGFSAEVLLEQWESQTETALWNATRALEEMVILLKRMAAQLRGHGHEDEALVLERRAEDALVRATFIREMAMRGDRKTKNSREGTEA